MTEQLGLEFSDLVEPPPGGKVSSQEAFELFHKLNPHVYRNIVMLARRLKERGRQKTSVWFLVNVLRWEHLMQTQDPSSDYQINNNYLSRYARLIMEREPRLADFFEVRQLKRA